MRLGVAHELHPSRRRHVRVRAEAPRPTADVIAATLAPARRPRPGGGLERFVDARGQVGVILAVVRQLLGLLEDVEEEPVDRVVAGPERHHVCGRVIRPGSSPSPTRRWTHCAAKTACTCRYMSRKSSVLMPLSGSTWWSGCAKGTRRRLQAGARRRWHTERASRRAPSAIVRHEPSLPCHQKVEPEDPTLLDPVGLLNRHSHQRRPRGADLVLCVVRRRRPTTAPARCPATRCQPGARASGVVEDSHRRSGEHCRDGEQRERRGRCCATVSSCGGTAT